MDILTILLIALGLAMDAFSVSVTDGIILKKPRFCDACKISLFFGGFQFLMPVLGYLLGSAFAKYITAFDHYIAFALLAFIGVKMIWEAFSETDEEIKNPLDTYTLFILAIATSIDALAVGITLATMAVSVLFASAVIGIVTFFICLFGVYTGSWCGNLLGNKAEVAGGLVLIGIGIKILLEHLFF